MKYSLNINHSDHLYSIRFPKSVLFLTIILLLLLALPYPSPKPTSAAGEALTISAPTTLSGTYGITATRFTDKANPQYYFEPAGTSVLNNITGNLSGTATTATNQSGGTVNATTGAFSGNVTFPGSGIWNSSGNVGIGTASPTLGKLQVNGGSGVAIRSDSSGPNATIYGVNSSVSGVGVTGYGSANGGIGVYGLGTGNGWDFYGAGPKSYFAGTVTASGVINASGGNSTQWNAASTGYGAVKVALVQNSAATTCQSRCATKYGSTWGCSVATAWAGGTNPAIGASYISCSDTTTTYKICTCFNFDYSL